MPEAKILRGGPMITDNARGAGLMMASMAGFVCNDTLMKLASEHMPMFQAIFVRGIMATLMIACLGGFYGALRFRPQGSDRWLLAIRVASEVCATFLFLTALFNMPIANATAILQVTPLAVTLGASLILREQVGWRRYTAITVGFLGVLLIIRPGSEGFTVYSLLALASVFCMVTRDLATRRLSAKVPSIFVAVATAASITLSAAIACAFEDWQPMAFGDVFHLGSAAIFLIIGYLFGVMTIRIGDIAFISPFRYSVLIWSILLGYFVFGDVPDIWMLIGSTIVVATGLYTFHRELVVARQSRLT